MGSTNQLAELVADAAEQGQTIVLGESAEQILDGLGVSTGLLLKLSNDLALVGGAQRRRLKNRHQLGILGQEATQLAHRSAGRLEGGGLDGGRVLLRRQNDAKG